MIDLARTGKDAVVVVRHLNLCAVEGMHRRQRLLSMCSGNAAMVIGAAGRHGRGSGTLSGNCQHQQPDQEDSD